VLAPVDLLSKNRSIPRIDLWQEQMPLCGLWEAKAEISSGKTHLARLARVRQDGALALRAPRMETKKFLCPGKIPVEEFCN
jgi:hypothetical protein